MRANLKLKSWRSLALMAGICAVLVRSTDVSAAGDSKPPQPPGKSGDSVRLLNEQLRQISIANVNLAMFETQRPAIGQIAFNEDASTVVLSPFPGRVTKLIGKIGDTVKRGSPLFEIDSSEVVQAQTDLIAAVQGLEKARAQLALTDRAVKRLGGLVTSKAASVRELDVAQSELAAAQSDVKTAEGTLLTARNRLRVLVGRSDAEIERVERERIVNPTFVVTAPIAGTIVNRKIGPGQFVRADSPDPLFMISDLSTMWLKASVPENDIPHVRVGQEIEVKVAALPGNTFKARITAIGAAADAATRRIVVRSELPNPGGLLRAEMFASFKIRTSESRAAPAVPIESVIREGDLATVWVEREPLVFQRRKVEIGMEKEDRIQIIKGLSAGERVIGRGAIFVDNEWRQ